MKKNKYIIMDKALEKAIIQYVNERSRHYQKCEEYGVEISKKKQEIRTKLAEIKKLEEDIEFYKESYTFEKIEAEKINVKIQMTEEFAKSKMGNI